MCTIYGNGDNGQGRSVSAGARALTLSFRIEAMESHYKIEHQRLAGMIVITRKVDDKQLIKNDSHIVNQSYNDVVKSAIPTDTDVS